MRRLHHTEISRTPLSELPGKRRLPLAVIVDNVRSLYNVGSIFRTCDGARVERLYLCGYTPYPPRREIEKTALGATDSVPWEYHAKVADAIAAARERGMWIAALEQCDTGISCFELDAGMFPLALVVGNEITGVSDSALELCDNAVDIPMLGMKHSLNVAVATGIVVFECVRVAGASL